MVAFPRPRSAPEALGGRRGVAAEPPVCAPSTRRRVLMWRAPTSPEARVVLPRRTSDKTRTLTVGNPRVWKSRFFRVALGVLVGALLTLVPTLQYASPTHTAPPSPPHPPPDGSSAVAFLFLTKGPTAEGQRALPHDHLWGKFFAKQDANLFLVRVHAPPWFTFNSTNTNAPGIFIGTEIPDPVFPIEWGGISMVKAEKSLLKSALLSTEPRAERFVLLSESCVPLRTFPFMYHYLLDGDVGRGGGGVHRSDDKDTDYDYTVTKPFEKSYVELSFDRHNRWPGHTHSESKKLLPKSNWRKSAQWFVLVRKHAEVVEGDTAVLSAFEKYCHLSSMDSDASAVSSNASDVNKPASFCAPDEHYVATLLSILGYENELERRVVTYANWWPSTRLHPKRYAVQETREAVTSIMSKYSVDDVFDGSDSKCGWYRRGKKVGQKKPCYLFARKFTEKAGRRIGRFSSVVIGY